MYQVSSRAAGEMNCVHVPPKLLLPRVTEVYRNVKEELNRVRV